MPKVSRDGAPERVEAPGFEGRYGQAGPYTIGFETYTEHADLAPLFVGLQDDRCQCEHWGYVLEGKVIFHSAQGDEEFVAGDAYQVGPGHTPEIFPGTRVVEFSPTAELTRTLEVVMRNMEAMGG
ncbi:MAG TPA: cupin domain-containing protein [Actinomycetota bacterium]|nr:cupin domain-containing protein [Actinomycetota bacterium]